MCFASALLLASQFLRTKPLDDVRIAVHIAAPFMRLLNHLLQTDKPEIFTAAESDSKARIPLYPNFCRFPRTARFREENPT